MSYSTRDEVREMLKDDALNTIIGDTFEEDAEERERRLATARVELAAESEFDVTIVNDSVERAAEELAALLGVRDLT